MGNNPLYDPKTILNNSTLEECEHSEGFTLKPDGTFISHLIELKMGVDMDKVFQRLELHETREDGEEVLHVLGYFDDIACELIQELWRHYKGGEDAKLVR